MFWDCQPRTRRAVVQLAVGPTTAREQLATGKRSPTGNPLGNCRTVPCYCCPFPSTSSPFQDTLAPSVPEAAFLTPRKRETRVLHALPPRPQVSPHSPTNRVFPGGITP